MSWNCFHFILNVHIVQIVSQENLSVKFQLPLRRSESFFTIPEAVAKI